MDASGEASRRARVSGARVDFNAGAAAAAVREAVLADPASSPADPQSSAARAFIQISRSRSCDSKRVSTTDLPSSPT